MSIETRTTACGGGAAGEDLVEHHLVFVAGGIALPPLRSVIWNCLDLRDQFEHNVRVRELVSEVNRTVARVREAQSRLRGAGAGSAGGGLSPGLTRTDTGADFRPARTVIWVLPGEMPVAGAGEPDGIRRPASRPRRWIPEALNQGAPSPKWQKCRSGEPAIGSS